MAIAGKLDPASEISTIRVAHNGRMVFLPRINWRTLMQGEGGRTHDVRTRVVSPRLMERPATENS